MFDSLPPHSFWTMSAVISALIVATITSAWLSHRQPEKDHSELILRVKSWWWMIGLVFACLMAGKTATLCFFAFLSFLALKEFLSIVPTRQVDRRLIFLCYLAIPLQYYWVHIAWYGMFIIFVPVIVFLLSQMFMALAGHTQGFIKASGIIHWALMLTVFCISHMAYVLALPTQNLQAGNIGLILYLLITTQLNDIAQYCWGKLFGKHKITPQVSPNKTWEGFVGGLLTTTVVGTILASFLTSLNLWQAALISLLIAFGGFIGDLVISSIKRDLAIKDTGTLIPGHGGILDRMDSLIFTAPTFFHCIYYLKY